MADQPASLWEVTHLIMQNPDRSSAEIAEAHGFSAAEIAETLPLFLDTVSLDFARLGGQVMPAAGPAPGESPEAFLDRYLGAVAGRTETADAQLTVTNGGSPTADAAELEPPPAFGAGAEHGGSEQGDLADDDQPAVTPGDRGSDTAGPEPAGIAQATDLPDAGTSDPDTTESDITDPDTTGEVTDTDFQFD